MAIDLGNVVGILQTAGGFIPGDQDFFDVGAALLGNFVGGQTVGVAPPSVATPTGTVQRMNPTCSANGTYKIVTTYDAATGQPIKQACAPKRRRRKRLATASDIKDLGALKAILGSGEVFKMYVATRGR